MNSIGWKRSLSAAAFGISALAWNTACAGGISLYEVGTADVGLASAGYTARAQDASTVFTNPAGMTRLAGDQFTLGAQVLYGDVGFSIGQGTTPALGGNAGGNPVDWLPGGGLFYSHSVSPDFKVGLALTGNFGSVVKYDDGWVGRYRAQEGTLLGFSILPSAAWRVNENLSLGASLNAMVGKFENRVAVNNIVGSDGSLELDDNAWGFGANLGLLYEVNQGTRFGITYTSPVKLDFSAQPQWSDLGTGIRALLASRGLLDANVDLGVTVPQGVNASFYHEIDPRWAVLGSVGWQQWSKFGEVAVGVDSNNPIGLTTAPRLQGHLARRRRCAIQVVRQVAAQRGHRLRLGIPGQQRRRARTARKRRLAFRDRCPEGGVEDVQLGTELRVPVRGQPAFEYCRQCACRAGWPWRRGRFVQQRRVLLPCRQWQLEVLKRVHLQEGSQ